MSFSTILLDWFAVNRRPLPWRETTDPYAVWLSEVILQQTRVAQGMAYWQRFMERWPDVESLANATEDEVLRMWQGLGYYSRARHLHAAARQIVEMGGFPSTLEQLRRLSGVGDYTAAAIASIAFGVAAAVVDGNVYRVLARYFGITTSIHSTRGKREFAELANSLLPGDRASDYNQALMDFGAVQCTPQAPRCGDCPLMESCVAFREGRVGELPVRERKTRVLTRRVSYLYIRCGHQTAIRQRGGGDIWQGLWELPSADDVEGEPRLLARGVRHVLTHRVLVADFFFLECRRRPELPAGFIWVDEQSLDRYALPRLVERLVDMVAGLDDPTKTDMEHEET